MYVRELSGLRVGAHNYSSMEVASMEPLFRLFMSFVAALNTSGADLMLIVAAIHVVTTLLLTRLLKGTGGIFLCSALASPVAFAFITNTIRQGFAMLLFTVAVVIAMHSSKRASVILLTGAVLALGFHKSSFILIVILLLSFAPILAQVSFAIACFAISILATVISPLKDALLMTAYLFDTPINVQLNSIEYTRLGGTLGPSLKYSLVNCSVCLIYYIVSKKCIDHALIKRLQGLLFGITGVTFIFSYHPFHDRWDSWLWYVFPAFICIAMSIITLDRREDKLIHDA